MARLDDTRRMLRQALRDAPSDFGSFVPVDGVRSPKEQIAALRDGLSPERLLQGPPPGSTPPSRRS